MYLRIVLLAAGLAVVCANPPAVQYPKCDKDVIENIKEYWEGAGIPEKVLSLEGVYSSYKSSDIPQHKDVKCTQYDFIPEGKIKTVTDGTESTIDATEKDGVVTVPEKTTYVILADDGVIALYNCSPDNETEDDDPTSKEDGTILVTEKADPNTLAHAEGIMRLLGFSLDKEYDCASSE